MRPAPAEQAGGDERDLQGAQGERECGHAACKSLGEHHPFCKFVSDQDRAALAQPSPASDLDPFNLAPHAEAFNEAPDEALRPEQAEAERPVVIARLYRSNDLTMTPFAEVQKPLPMPRSDGTLTVEPLMTVAQHERIVKAWIERWKAYIELSAKIAAQRDAALAKLAELETALTPFAAVADAYDDSVDDDHEPYTDMGCDDRLRLTLSQHRAARTALSGAPSQAQHSVPEASEQEKEQGWTLDYRFVERVTDLAASRTEYTTSMEATEQVLLAARELLAAAPGKEGA